MSVWLRHSASTSEISGREVWGGCNILRHVGITSLMLSNRAVEVLTTSNASIKCTSESSIHGDGGKLVGLHVFIATTYASIATVWINVLSNGAGSGRPLLAALMQVLSANVVLLPPGPYLDLLVLLRLRFSSWLEFPLYFFLWPLPGEWLLFSTSSVKLVSRRGIWILQRPRPGIRSYVG